MYLFGYADLGCVWLHGSKVCVSGHGLWPRLNPGLCLSLQQSDLLTCGFMQVLTTVTFVEGQCAILSSVSK